MKPMTPFALLLGVALAALAQEPATNLAPAPPSVILAPAPAVTTNVAAPAPGAPPVGLPSAMTAAERRAAFMSNRAMRALSATNLAHSTNAIPAPVTATPVAAGTNPSAAVPPALAPKTPTVGAPTTPPALAPKTGLAPGPSSPLGTVPKPAGPGTPAATGRLPGAGQGPGGAASTTPRGGDMIVRPLPGGGTTNIMVQASDEDVIPKGMIDFKEADLSQVLDIYAELTGRTILRPATLPAVKINLRAQTLLTRREGIQALESVFALNQIATVPMEDKFVKVLQSQNVINAGGRPTAVASNIAEFGPFVTHIVQLKYADPAEVLQVVQPFAQLPNSIVAVKSSQILVLRDYAENIKRMLELIEKVDVMVPLQYEPVVIPIKYALATDIQSVISGLSAGGGGMTVGSSGSSGRGLSGGGGSMGGMGGRSGGFGSTMGTGMGSTGYQPGMTQQGMGTMGSGATGAGGSLGGARSAFANRLQNIIRSAGPGGGAGGSGDIQIIGVAKIIADERTNSLLVFADKQDMTTITNIIAKLDVVLAQVLIEGIVASIGLNDSFNAGVSYKQRKATTVGDFAGAGAINPAKILNKDAFFTAQGTNGAVGIAEGFTYVAQLGDSLDVVVQAMASDSHAQIIEKPRILTSHAKEASIFIGQTRPYITGYTAGGGYYGNYSQYQQLQIGINLSILPFINSEGLVVMDIRQRIQGIAGSVNINGNEVPITSDKEATAYIAVRDRDTVLLGGYIDSNISKSHAGVPWLMDIPLLGALFKTHNTSKDRTETVLLVRPTVLNTPEAAATATTLERDNMPGLRHAETLYDQQTREEQQKYKALQEQEQQKEKKKGSKKSKTTSQD